ncbi:epoxyqueuosine reductase [Dehalobacterium formicoaceticum]|uniref:Epoxyqueuosine reductase n=1 Tax=Dehalobacterium formicoaceticum TaxID=51515 RepID=A0ABT1Y1R3_9FIRM|nr:epoxyqueuosine reductase [Dehalobacterium formicoaceticum]MCR6544441.1 epoxyqueuosine reductase [Dehalobacterium formicoaceticum]
MELKEKIEGIINEMVQDANTQTCYRPPLIGYASAHDHLFTQMKNIIGPHVVHPREILPEAKTVVAFFVPFSEGIVRANRSAQGVPVEWARAYIEANTLIGDICARLKDELEKEGIPSGFQKATHNFNEVDLTAAWSHRSAAYVAGLGTFGLNHLLITPAGCAGRFGSIIIAREIPPTPKPTEEYCLYYQKGTCTACVKNCPTGALQIDSWDKQRCYAQLLQVAEDYPQLGLCDVCGKCNLGPCALSSC